MEVPTIIPLLPLKNTVVFPGTAVPLVVGRAASVRALKKAKEKNNLIIVSAQKNGQTENPEPDGIYNVGTLCSVGEFFSIKGDQSYQVMVTGLHRYHIEEFVNKGDYFEVHGQVQSDLYSNDSARTQALFNSLKEISKELVSLFPGSVDVLIKLIDAITEPNLLANLCATYLNISMSQKQALLEKTSVEGRIEDLLEIMKNEREVLRLQNEIQDKMSERLNKSQREALLREQMKVIRDELGEQTSRAKDDLGTKIKKAKMPEEVRKVADEEFKRLEGMPEASAEYYVIRNYLDWLIAMPWQISTPDIIDLSKARAILDEDHYGLEKVKKRILEFLAVAKLKNDLHGPILCLVGPPGVGKTSLGQSIARALGRKFVQASLGGIRDEAEIRGHRRTYIGAMPGRIVQGFKRVGVNNPVMLLDEIDKLGTSYQGDPSSALLEVLDPEQNKNFVDHYLDVPFDLSRTFFIATANIIDTIPAPLRDRMEIIEVPGYTISEKIHIGRKYLIPRQLSEHGISSNQMTITDGALELIISGYTREAGVRELQRQIAAICRAVAQKIAEGATTPIIVDHEKVTECLGSQKFFPEVTERKPRPGVVTGLAWTPVGGEILFIESSLMPGNGKLILTGQLGDVMKESAQIALSFARTETDASQIDWSKNDLHIHVPAGAIPKDGPSAGVALLTSIVSLITKKTVNPRIGMTGEITLRGAVLPVGGIKDKVMAAQRAGVKEVILPRRNEKDLNDIPEEIRKLLKFHFVENIKDVLNLCFSEGEIKQSTHSKNGQGVYNISTSASFNP